MGIHGNGRPTAISKLRTMEEYIQYILRLKEELEQAKHEEQIVKKKYARATSTKHSAMNKYDNACLGLTKFKK